MDKVGAGVVEYILGALYQVIAAVGRFLGSLILDIIGGSISSKIEDYFTNETKLEKHVKMLSGEKWFDELVKDYRYSYIVWNNKRVGGYLMKLSNIQLLKKHEEEQDKFKEMVKWEHRKFTNL